MIRTFIYALTILLIFSLAFNLQLMDLVDIQIEQADKRDTMIWALEKRDNEITSVVNHIGSILGGKVAKVGEKVGG